MTQFKHLTDDEWVSILNLIKFLIDNQSNIIDSLKDQYRKSIKDKTRRDFLTIHFGNYMVFKNVDKMTEAFNKMGRGMYNFANFIPDYKTFMEWLSIQTGRPL